MSLAELRRTKSDRTAAGVRIFLGVLFLMAGLMKLFVPALTDAFIGQLAAAELPLPELSRWFVPLVEVAVGTAMLRDFHVRLSALVVLGLMTVATYVHLVVEDPALFPLQPTEPIIPIIVIVAALFVLFRGGGAESLDLETMDGASS